MANHGMTSKEAAEFRYVMHTKALGFAKSSKKLTDDEFSKILAVFWAYSRPTDTAAQIRQQEQALKRAQHVLQKLVDELGYDSKYLEGVARRICKKPLARCYEPDLAKLIAALTIHKNRKQKQAATTSDPF